MTHIFINNILVEGFTSKGFNSIVSLFRISYLGTRTYGAGINTKSLQIQHYSVINFMRLIKMQLDCTSYLQSCNIGNKILANGDITKVKITVFAVSFTMASITHPVGK